MYPKVATAKRFLFPATTACQQWVRTLCKWTTPVVSHLAV